MSRRTILLLLCLALAAGVSSGSDSSSGAASASASPSQQRQARDDASRLIGALPGRRQLQQTQADCARSVPGCKACRFQFFKGTVTRAVCTQCDTGYVVKKSGQECWCSPGYKWNATSAACERCGADSYCLGSSGARANAVARPCGLNKVTSSEVARSAKECRVRPGYGWAAGDASAPCPLGFYNPGYNTRPCSRCPGGLTTRAEGALSPAECVAPAGSYYLRGKAIPCAQGTFKEAAGNVDCDECPDGFTTRFGDVGKVSRAECKYVMPGYSAPAGLQASLGNASATACPADTYRAGTELYSDAAGVPCTPCGDGLRTNPNVVGAATRDACLAAPGYGFSAATGNATICAEGWYNLGFNREPCVKCGAGTVTTSGQGAESADDCLTPAGHGSSRGADGVLTGAPCPRGTFGRDTATFGLIEVECTKCLENTVTPNEASTSPADCVTLAGYGYYDGAALQCDYGTYNNGSNQNPCQLCGEGYNTSTAADGTLPALGADSQSDCVIAAGWTTDGAGGIKPCTQGYYKSLLGASECVKCPNGTTTTLAIRSSELSDCDACRPGFGNDALDLASPGCALCPSGTWSYGYVLGGKACEACPRPANYAGDMVSRRGLDDPDGCYPEFMTDAATTSLTYNLIPMSDGAFARAIANNTLADCQQACKDDADCQYYTWRDDGGGASTCRIRQGGRAAADVAGSLPVILFEISDGIYVAYNALPNDVDYAGTGRDLATFSSFAAAKASCDVVAACVGIKGDGAGGWKTFAGALAEFVTSRVRVRGEAINAWVPEPTGA